jgi:phage/plasmid primase-like uncharacterized protein
MMFGDVLNNLMIVKKKIFLNLLNQVNRIDQDTYANKQMLNHQQENLIEISIGIEIQKMVQKMMYGELKETQEIEVLVIGQHINLEMKEIEETIEVQVVEVAQVVVEEESVLIVLHTIVKQIRKFL